MDELSTQEKVIGTRDFESYLDKEVVLLLWEGKYLYGILRSYDQFNSVTLENTRERIFYKNMYAEKKCGVYFVRGENILLLGITSMKLNGFKKVSFDEIFGFLKNV